MNEEDKNNINTRSLDDLSNLDSNNDDFFQNEKKDFSNVDFFAGDAINFDEEKENTNKSNDDYTNLLDNLAKSNNANDADDSDEIDSIEENEEDDISDDLFAGLNFEDNKTASLDDDLSANETKIEDNKDKAVQNNGKKKIKKPLTKKQKIILISISCVIVLLLICLIVYLLLPKNKEETPNEPTETIVVDKGNYKYQDGTLVFLNDNKTEIGTYDCEIKEEDKCYISYLSNDNDDVNTTKNIYEDNTPVQFRSEIFHNRYVFVNDGDTNTIKLYDILENKVISTYRSIKYYESLGDNYVVLENNDGKFGLVKITSNDMENVINFNYDNLISLDKKDNILIAKKGSKYYLIDFNDKSLTKAITKPIYDYDDKHLVVKNNNSYNLVDYDNNEIFTDYNYISIINDNYVALVSDGALYIRDYEKNKYNEVGYSLYNESYSGLNTYTKEGILKISTYAYKINVNNNTLTVFLKNNNDTEEKGLNLLDGKASINNSYYSSFAGILYFYSDLEKTNLLGSYVCTNKDDFNNSLEFKMCALAHNYSFNENFKNHDAGLTNNVLPIIDNRYVFITDDINSFDGEVKVYDLYKKQVLATYKHVSANFNKDNTFMSNIDNIIVKNKSDKFGVININNNGITKNYDFIYDRMEQIGNYIEVAKDNKYQILFNSDSSSISLDSKIYDFSGKYFVVKNNDKFAIYSDDGTDNPKKITNKSYKVIRLVGESIYVGIDDDNKVYVNTYDNTTINNEEIKLDNNSDIFSLYNMVSASVSGNNVILNTYDSNGNKINSYTFPMPKKESGTIIPDITGEDNNEATE